MPASSLPIAASAAFCPSLSGKGLDGSMRRPASGSRRLARAAILTSPFSASARNDAGVVFSSRQRGVIHPPPSRTIWSTSHRWRVVRERLVWLDELDDLANPAESAGSTKSCSFARAFFFSTAAGSAARSTDSIGAAV